MKTVHISTSKRCEFIDITHTVREYIRESGIENGAVIVFIPHTTAGVTINENADPDVIRDLLFALDRAVPDTGFTHGEGNSDAHTKALLTGFSLNVIIEKGNLMLGTWQSIYFCEYDGARNRKIYLQNFGMTH